MSAKAQLLAAARSGGSAAVRALVAAGGPQESIVVRAGSLGALQYRLTDHNYHSVEAERVTPGLIRLSAPCGYGVEDVATTFGLEIVVGWDN